MKDEYTKKARDNFLSILQKEIEDIKKGYFMEEKQQILISLCGKIEDLCSASCCPYCIEQKEQHNTTHIYEHLCRLECPYAKTHGVCDNKGSDWLKINHALLELRHAIDICYGSD